MKVTRYEAAPATYHAHTATPEQYGLNLGGREVQEGDLILTDPETSQGFAIAPDDERYRPAAADVVRNLEARVKALETKANKATKKTTTK